MGLIARTTPSCVPVTENASIENIVETSARISSPFSAREREKDKKRVLPTSQDDQISKKIETDRAKKIMEPVKLEFCGAAFCALPHYVGFRLTESYARPVESRSSDCDSGAGSRNTFSRSSQVNQGISLSARSLNNNGCEYEEEEEAYIDRFDPHWLGDMSGRSMAEEEHGSSDVTDDIIKSLKMNW